MIGIVVLIKGKVGIASDAGSRFAAFRALQGFEGILQEYMIKALQMIKKKLHR
jgi:hypothetical protein